MKSPLGQSNIKLPISSTLISIQKTHTLKTTASLKTACNNAFEVRGFSIRPWNIVKLHNKNVKAQCFLVRPHYVVKLLVIGDNPTGSQRRRLGSPCFTMSKLLFIHPRKSGTCLDQDSKSRASPRMEELGLTVIF